MSALGKREFGLRHYFVAFLDVLGQRDELRSLKWPRTDEERVATARTLERTAGFVLELRKSFEEFFDEQARPTGLLDGLPEAALRQAQLWRKSTVSHRGMSDSIVITVPLSNENDHCNSLGSTFSAMFAAAGVFVISLSQQRALRAGLDVGVGVEIAPNEIYGAGPERAYRLESRVASWPRILVGPDLWNYLSSAESQLPNTASGQLAKQFASAAMSLVTVSEDGHRMLDFLGQGVRSITDGLPLEAIRAAYDFVRQEEQRFLDAGDLKLAPRYAVLRRYMESRLSLWGVS
jgi:hypothetical protein